jgi:hypothetical protein
MPPSSAADRLERAGPLPGTHAPDPACDSSGSEGAVLLLMDTKDASDLQHKKQQQQRETQQTQAAYP